MLIQGLVMIGVGDDKVVSDDTGISDDRVVSDDTGISDNRGW